MRQGGRGCSKDSSFPPTPVSGGSEDRGNRNVWDTRSSRGSCRIRSVRQDSGGYRPSKKARANSSDGTRHPTRSSSCKAKETQEDRGDNISPNGIPEAPSGKDNPLPNSGDRTEEGRGEGSGVAHPKGTPGGEERQPGQWAMWRKAACRSDTRESGTWRYGSCGAVRRWCDNPKTETHTLRET